MLIDEITLRGLLSFGPVSEPLQLRPLNVLIGPNGSGKSNFIEAIGLLRSSASKLTAPLRGASGGGIKEWLWKGAVDGPAELNAIINYPNGKQALRHRIKFTDTASRFELIDEAIENQNPDYGHEDPFFYYRFQNGKPAIATRDANRRPLRREDVAPDESILSQRKDPDLYPELAYLSQMYGKVRLYREWSFGRTSVFRSPQSADMPSDRLEEDFSNLGLFLNQLQGLPKAERQIIEHLHDLYEGLDSFRIGVKGGTVEVVLREGDFSIPASRLSDGTLRYLCLLAILCDPEPPPLICIEEPELGLHPDILPKLADLMLNASARTQIIVTTHSDVLVDAMTDQPENVVIVEKQNGQTKTRRLRKDDELKAWLENYRLGQLWTRGELGGTRW